MAKRLKAVSKTIKLELIDEPAGIIRLEIDPEEIKGLAANIKAVGLLQPIVVRAVNERYEIVYGHRRFLAVKSLGREEISCIVRAFSDVDCALARASENRCRVDLSPVEEAAVYADLRDRFGLSYDEISDHMGVSGGIVRRRLDLLKMPESLQQAVHFKRITVGVAEEFSRLSDPAKIDYFLGYAVEHGCTVLVARGWVNDEKKRERGAVADVAGGGDTVTPLESTPVYISCDLCRGPVKIEELRHFRTCVDCFNFMREAVAKLSQSKGG